MLTSVCFLPTGLFPSLSKILSNSLRKSSQGITLTRRPKVGFSCINISCGSCGSQKLGWKLVCDIDDAERLKSKYNKAAGSLIRLLQNMTRGGSDGARRSLSMACLDSQAKARNLPLPSGEFGGRVIFRCALKRLLKSLQGSPINWAPRKLPSPHQRIVNISCTMLSTTKETLQNPSALVSRF